MGDNAFPMKLPPEERRAHKTVIVYTYVLVYVAAERSVQWDLNPSLTLKEKNLETSERQERRKMDG